MEHTPGEWRLKEDAQGPCMIMHPTKHGVAIASLTQTFEPVGGFVGDEHGHGWPEERNANARLFWAAPDLLAVLLEVEWGIDTLDGGKNGWVCPYCSGIKSRRGHTATCRLNKAIAKVKGAP